MSEKKSLFDLFTYGVELRWSPAKNMFTLRFSAGLDVDNQLPLAEEIISKVKGEEEADKRSQS